MVTKALILLFIHVHFSEGVPVASGASIGAWKPAEKGPASITCDISIVNADNLTSADFLSKYADAGKAVLIRGGIEHWPKHLWSKQHLYDIFGNITLQIKPAAKPAAEMPVSRPRQTSYDTAHGPIHDMGWREYIDKLVPSCERAPDVKGCVKAPGNPIYTFHHISSPHLPDIPDGKGDHASRELEEQRVDEVAAFYRDPMGLKSSTGMSFKDFSAKFMRPIPQFEELWPMAKSGMEGLTENFELFLSVGASGSGLHAHQHNVHALLIYSLRSHF